MFERVPEGVAEEDVSRKGEVESAYFNDPLEGVLPVVNHLILRNFHAQHINQVSKYLTRVSRSSKQTHGQNKPT